MSYPNNKIIVNLPSEDNAPQIENNAVILAAKKATLYPLARRWGVVSLDGVSVSALNVASLKIAVIKAQEAFSGDSEYVQAPEKLTKAVLIERVLAKHPNLQGVKAMNKETLLAHLERDAEDAEKEEEDEKEEDELLTHKKLFETKSRQMTCQVLKHLLIKAGVEPAAFKNMTKPELETLVMEKYKWAQPVAQPREKQVAKVLPYTTWLAFIASKGYPSEKFNAADIAIKHNLVNEYTQIVAEAQAIDDE